MTSGVGNPDWQRRYTTSAAPIATGTFLDDVNRILGPLDTNGYQYLLVTTNDGAATTYKRIKIDWYQDQALTQFMGTTAYVVAPSQFIVQKIPVITRWYQVEIGPVGGVTGHNTSLVIYGTNADQENMLTQDTDVPAGFGNPNLGTGVISTTILSGTFGGRVFVSVDQNANNKWTAWMEFYNWNTQAWVQFWTIHGPDHGQSYSSDAVLPYAPVRINVRNDDTVAHAITWSVVEP